jgi:prepilin-type processing-associated H-X9-DG protein
MTEVVKTAKTSLLAIWSLILGVVSITGCGMIAGLPAIICGFMARSKIKDSSGELQGNGMAMGGLITGFIGTVLTTLAVLGILAGMLLPAVATARDRARRASGMNNLAQIGKASMMYSMDNDEKRPANFQSLKLYTGDSPRLFVCPATGKQPGAFSDVDSWTDYVLVPGLTEESPPQSVFVFTHPDCYPNGGGNILFLDGSVQWCDPATYDELTAHLR